MQPNTYQFFLKNKAGQYFYIDESDTLAITATPTEIVEPKGWNEMIGEMMSVPKYKGNFKKVTTPLSFVKNGKRIIDYLAITQGTQAFCDIVINVFDADALAYDIFFNGRIDFSPSSLVVEEFYTKANINELTLIDILDAKDSVEIEIPLTPANSVDVVIDGVGLTNKTVFGVNEGYASGNASYYKGSHIAKLISVRNENATARDTERVKVFGTATNSELDGSGNHFYLAEENTTLNFSYDFKAIATYSGGGSFTGTFRYEIRVVRPNNATEFTTIIYSRTGSAAVFVPEHLISGTVTVNVIANDKIYFVCILDGANDENVKVTYPVYANEFSFFTVRQRPATSHKGIRPFKLLAELVAKVTDNEYAANSNYLAADLGTVLIPGSSLRQDANVSIKTTIRDFLKYCYVNHLAVLTDVVSGTAEMKHIKDTFINSEFINLGTVADLSWRFASERMVSTIKVGYENLDLGVDGQTNGKDEFNQTNHFTTGQTNLKAEYDIVSPYIASMYAFEKLRVKYAVANTTDSNGDNKVHVLDAVQGADVGYYTGDFTVTFGNLITILGFPTGVLANSVITITNTGAVDGTYNVQSVVSLTNPDRTDIDLVQAIAAGTYTGTITYYSATHYKPRRPAYTSITGVLSPTTAFNTEISPAHLLRLHSPIIAGGVYGTDGVIKFESGDKNVLLETVLNGVTVKENANLQISDLPLPYYLPIEVTFLTDYDKSIFAKMGGINKYRLIGFVWNDVKLQGYAVEVKSNADNGEKQTWKLLLKEGINLLNIL
jgi:hypothetical protein